MTTVRNALFLYRLKRYDKMLVKLHDGHRFTRVVGGGAMSAASGHFAQCRQSTILETGRR